MNLESPIAAGTRLGRYEIRQQLGSGGMGEVYLARDMELDRPVAIKFLPADVASDQKRMQRFVQEAKAVSALNHPNILTIYGIVQTDAARFFVAEFVDGLTLRQHMARKQMKLGEVLEVAIQIARALVAAHAAGIVHRDIKPENVMLRKDGYVKVLDFGLAKLTERRPTSIDTEAATQALVNTDPGAVMGTASYMSPEQASGREVDHRTDLWSLGVVLYEMLTGHLPFEGTSPSHTIVSILDNEPQPLARYLPDAPESLQEIVADALTKDPEARFQTAKQMLSKLQRLKQRLDAGASLDHSVAPDAAGHTSDAGLSLGGGLMQPTAGPGAHTTARSGQIASTTHTVSSAEFVAEQIKTHRKGFIIAVSVAVVLLAGLTFGLYKLVTRTQTGASQPGASSRLKLTKVTGSGLTNEAAISPDGKFVVRVANEGGKQSLRLRQVTMMSEKEIAPSSPDISYRSLAFAPDSSAIYYVKNERTVNVGYGTLYRVSLLGGDAQKLVFDVDSSVSFAPDGKHMAFMRHSEKRKENDLVIANEDGTGEQVLLTRKFPNYHRNFAWSPDGRVIAYSIDNKDQDGYYATLEAVNVADRTTKAISTARWKWINSVCWLSDGSGLIVTGKEKASTESEQGQVWLVSYPEGSAHRITNDLNNYYGATLTADSRSLLVIQTNVFSDILVLPGGYVARVRQLTNSNTPINWLIWMPDGRIVYDSQASGNWDIWMMNTDGSGTKQLTFNPENDFVGTISPDGRFIIFNSTHGGVQSLWRMDADGGNAKELVHNPNGASLPHVSPDSQWVFYGGADESGKSSLWKVSIEGGEPVKVRERSWSHRLSPDGKQFIALDREPNAGVLSKIIIFPVEGGEATKTLEMPPELGSEMDWSPDGQSIDYIATRDGATNIWRLPLAGGKPRQITDWKTDVRIYWFAWSRDGKQLGIVRDTPTSDLLLIQNFR